MENTPTALVARYAAAQLSWWPVLLFLPARFVFAFIAQGMAAGMFALQGASDASAEAARHWIAYSSLADIFCLLMLVWLTRREGLTLLDLFGARGLEAARQLLWTPLYLLAVFPSTIVAFFASQWFYGSAAPPLFTVLRLTPAEAWYTQFIWPIVWVVTEELVYLGYLLPRLEAAWGKRWVAVMVVVLVWGAQHAALPWLPNTRYLLWRIISATVAVALLPVVFVLGRRRLLPFIAIHYLADLSTALIATGVIPYR